MTTNHPVGKDGTRDLPGSDCTARSRTEAFKERFRAYTTALFLLAGSAFVVHYVFENRSSITEAFSQLRPLPALAALAVSVSGYVAVGSAWSDVLKAFGSPPVPRLRAFSISSVSWLGRYIPGKVWLFAARATLTRSEGVPLRIVTAAIAAEVLLFMVAGLVVSLLLSPFAVMPEHLSRWLSWLGLAAGAGLAATLHPKIWGFIERALLRGGDGPTLSRSRVFLALAQYSFAFGAWAFSYFLVAASFSPIPVSAAPGFCAIVSASWLVGFFAFFAPAGIGVRESLIGAYLTGQLGVPVPTAFATVAAARLLATVAEGLCISIGVLVLGVKRIRQPAGIPED